MRTAATTAAPHHDVYPPPHHPRVDPLLAAATNTDSFRMQQIDRSLVTDYHHIRCSSFPDEAREASAPLGESGTGCPKHRSTVRYSVSYPAYYPNASDTMQKTKWCRESLRLALSMLSATVGLAYLHVP